MKTSIPRRGEVWRLDFDPAQGHEQAGLRPALIVSDDDFNRLPWRLCVVLPLSTTLRLFSLHVTIHPPEGGCRQPSVIMCQHLRSVSLDRLDKRLGTVTDATLAEVDFRLKSILALAGRA
ncbi:MAG: type II toxin-antitoxin system PemK/MazF family toxin [Planctomycetota bacterium]